MKNILYLLSILIITCSNSQGEKDVLLNKAFKNDNIFKIVCKGYPKPGVYGIGRIETAKEAALINAQLFAKNIFLDSVDVIRKGTIEKYEVFPDYSVIHYVVKEKGLRKKMKKK